MTVFRSILALLLGSPLIPAFAFDVIVVDTNGSGDFPSLAAATIAAADGDVLLVRPGDYGGDNVLINAKGLTIVRDGAGTVRGTGPSSTGNTTPSLIVIRNLPAGKEVHLSGLSYDMTEMAFCNGLILIEDSEPWADGAPCQVGALFCNSVTITNSNLRGVDGFEISGGQQNDGANGGGGLTVVESTVTVYSTAMLGGDGDDGVSDPYGCGTGGDGGPGLSVLGSASVVRHLDCTFSGGDGGEGDCSNGLPGPDIDNSGGTLIPLAMMVYPITGDAVIREGNTYTLSIGGIPGTVPALLTSTAMFQRNLPPSVGVLHLLWPFSVNYLSPIPDSGVLNFDIAIPTLPNGVDSAWRIMQLAINDPLGRFLTRPFSLTVVDDGF
ncbi:MAG: hypothetical protein CMJ84_14165 [Planctomycetes bacterium]|nr:hypothetical protein [Planctomycetota bacterium]